MGQGRIQLFNLLGGCPLLGAKDAGNALGAGQDVVLVESQDDAHLGKAGVQTGVVDGRSLGQVGTAQGDFFSGLVENTGTQC